ncbi:MAG: hypothetical protein PsegKO_19140 [Pseudohongiellaceae bacterium]
MSLIRESLINSNGALRESVGSLKKRFWIRVAQYFNDMVSGRGAHKPAARYSVGSNAALFGFSGLLGPHITGGDPRHIGDVFDHH